jgi:hypothetical protein
MLAAPSRRVLNGVRCGRPKASDAGHDGSPLPDAGIVAFATELAAK